MHVQLPHDGNHEANKWAMCSANVRVENAQKYEYLTRNHGVRDSEHAIFIAHW